MNTSPDSYWTPLLALLGSASLCCSPACSAPSTLKSPSLHGAAVAGRPAQHAAAHAPPAASTASAPAAQQAGVSPPHFYLVNETDQHLSLLEHAGVALVAGGPIFSRLDPNGIREDESFGKGLNLNFLAPVTALAGSFGGELFATMIQSNGRTGWGELYRRGKQGGWSRVGGALPATYTHLGIGSWSDGRVLTLEGGDMPMGAQPFFRFRIVSGPAAPLPQLTPAGVVPLTEDPNEQCKYWRTAAVPQRLLVLPSGDVFTFGPNCQQSGHTAEHWEPGQTKSSLYLFPSSTDWRLLKAVARSARDVTLVINTATEPLLAHFDGAGWTTESLGIGPREVLDSDLASDGTLFVVARVEPKDERGALWWRVPGQAAFAKLYLPARPTPEKGPVWLSGASSVVATSRDDVWVVVGNALFHSQPAPAGSKKIAWGDDQQFPGDLRLPKPASAGCSDVYVLLYAITQSTPKNYDFPLTRKALAGHPELQNVTLAETEDNGRRFFGAFVKDYTQGQKLSQLVREKVKGSIPAVLCARPKVVRDLNMDWKTGQLQ